VDIEGARNTSPQKSYTVDTVVLKGVRIGQFRAKDPSVVRVVADLKGNPAFDVHSTPSGLRIELRPRGMMNSAPLANQLLNPAAKPEGSKTLAITAVTSAHIAVSKVAVPAPTTEVIERKPAAAPPVQAENQEAVKPEVQSTLPALVNSKQAMAAPLPPPSSATPEALRANHAALALNPVRDEAGQGVLPGNPTGPSAEARPA
jgi:hypothetical protein